MSSSPLDTTLSILSIQSSNMGHRTYAEQMRSYFASSQIAQMDSYWLDQDRDMVARIFCRLMSLNLPSKFVEQNNLDFRRFRSEIGYAYQGKQLAIRNLRRMSYNLLYFHTQMPALLASNLMRHIPTVISGDMTAAQVANAMPNIRYQFTHRPNIEMEKRLFSVAKQIVLWSEWAAQSVITDYGISATKVKVVHPGVDLSKIPYADKDATRKKLVQLLFVGHDFDRKGGRDLLKVFIDGLSTYAELHLVTNRCSV